MIHTEDYDLQPKRKFKAADAAQLVFSVLCVINAGYLCYRDNYNGNTCPRYEYFNYVLLIGSAIWTIYLLITLVIQFKDKGTRLLLNAMDWLFILFHIGLFIWANVQYWKRTPRTCSAEWDHWVFVYLLFGYVAFFCVLAAAFMGLLRMVNRRRYVRENPDYKFVHNDLPYTEMGEKGQIAVGDFDDAYAMYD